MRFVGEKPCFKIPLKKLFSANPLLKIELILVLEKILARDKIKSCFI